MSPPPSLPSRPSAALIDHAIVWHLVERQDDGSGSSFFLRLHDDDRVYVKKSGRRGRLLSCGTTLKAGASERRRPEQDLSPTNKRPKLLLQPETQADKLWYNVVQYDDDGSTEKIAANQLIPIYRERARTRNAVDEEPPSLQSPPPSAIQQQQSLPILVTADTESFRLLAASQVVDSSSNSSPRCVLEIGSSTGETSQQLWKLLDNGGVQAWMGWDTGADMVRRVQKKILEPVVATVGRRLL